MIDINKFILEKLKVNKDTDFDFASHWGDKDKYIKYKYDSLYYVFNLIKDKIEWDKKIEHLYSTTFSTSLTGDDLEKLNKTLGQDKKLASNEWRYDYSKKSFLDVNIFKEHLLKIHNYYYHPTTYDLTLENGGKEFYEKYYKDVCKK